MIYVYIYIPIQEKKITIEKTIIKNIVYNGIIINEWINIIIMREE